MKMCILWLLEGLFGPPERVSILEPLWMLLLGLLLSDFQIPFVNWL